MPVLSVPVIYPVVYRPPGSGHWSGAWKRAHHDLTVEELDADEVPVVATCRVPVENAHVKEASFDAIHGRDREIRHDGERFYVEWGTVRDLEDEVAKLTDATHGWIDRAYRREYGPNPMPQTGTLFASVVSFEAERPIPRTREPDARRDEWNPVAMLHDEVVDDGGARAARRLLGERALVAVGGLVYERIGRPTFVMRSKFSDGEPAVRPGDGSFRPTDKDSSHTVPLADFQELARERGWAFDTDTPHLFAAPSPFRWYRHETRSGFHAAASKALPAAVDHIYDALDELDAATLPTVHLVACVRRMEEAMASVGYPTVPHVLRTDAGDVTPKWTSGKGHYASPLGGLRLRDVAEALALDVEGPSTDYRAGTATGILPSFRGEAERALSVQAGNPTSPDDVRERARSVLAGTPPVEIADWGNLLEAARRTETPVPVVHDLAREGVRFWQILTGEGAHAALVAVTPDMDVHVSAFPGHEPPAPVVIEAAFGAWPTPFPDGGAHPRPSDAPSTASLGAAP